MPASASISTVSPTPPSPSPASTSPSSPTGSGDGFRDALEKASAKPSESPGKTAANEAATGSGQAADPGAAAGAPDPSQSAGDPQDAAADAAPAASTDGNEAAVVDPSAGNVVPPWLPLAGQPSEPIEPNADAGQTPAALANAQSEAIADDTAMPAMLLQAMRQSPQLKAESTPVADVGDVPTPASPTPRPVPLVTDVAATSGAATSATTADAAPAASPEQLLAAVSATSGQGADTGADAGAMPVNRGEMPADFGRLTASATVGPGPSLPARGAEFANASVPVPMSNPQWGEAFASRIAMQVRDGVQQVSLALNPAELGPVEVRLSVSDGQVSAHFHSAHQNVRQAIEDAMPRLREMLSQSGLNLADANVSQQAPRRDEHAAGGQGGRWSGTDDDRHAESGDDATTVTATRTLGLVDAYV